MLANGTLLQNRYLIKRPLAQGGMGTVYEAEAIHLGHAPVAVKQTFFAQDWLREQFQREASMLARLRHDALPRVSDHFVEGPGQFLVMEFIPGQDLDDILSEKLKGEDSPFEWRQVMKWADRLLDALEYIHNQHPPIIHRDIKPSNLKLTPRGDLFLIDFGLAKDATTPTKPGRSVHAYTLNYAPLEQLKGTGTDARSDLYSLGATLYHLLSGEMPENAKVREEVIRYGVPDPLHLVHKINSQVPEPLAQMLARSMMLDRAERYQNASGMREALRQVQQTIEEELTKPGRQETEPRRPKEKERRRQGEVITRELPESERRRYEEEERRYLEEARQRHLEEERRRQEESTERERLEAERRKLEEENRLREEEERLLVEQRRQNEEKRQQEVRQHELEEQWKREEEKRRQEEQRIAEQKRLEQETRELEKRRPEEQRLAEQKRLEQEQAQQRKLEEEKRQQEEQRLAEQKRLEQGQAEKRRQEEETRREDLNQREFERKRKKEIERRKRPDQVTKVQAIKTTPKFKSSDKPFVVEKALTTVAVETSVIERAPDALAPQLLPKADPSPKIESLPKQERKRAWVLNLRSPHVHLGAGVAAILIGSLIFWSWLHGRSETTLQVQTRNQSTPQPLASASSVGESAEQLQYWFEQFRNGQASLVAKHELASEQEFKLHFKPREDGYLYLLAPYGITGELKSLLPDGERVRAGRDFVFPNGQNIQGRANGEQFIFTVFWSRNRIENFKGGVRQVKSQPEAIKTLQTLVEAIPPSGIEDLSGRGTPANAVNGKLANRPLTFDINLKFTGN